jgi:hypothetical protein
VIEARTEGGLATAKRTALLVTPCADAVICAVPADTPLVSPATLTVATLTLELDHVNMTPLMAFPYWSCPTAANCCVPPTKIEDAVGVTPMVVNTGGGGSTVRDADALLMPEADAVMCTVPGDTPVASPLSTVAELPLDDHTKMIPFITLLN